MIFVSTLITFLLFDDITASSISIIYHIHSDIPHHWITDILYTNHTASNNTSNKSPNHLSNNNNNKASTRDYSLLNVFDNGNNEIFVNGKSFSQIMHDQFRPSLQNLLPLMNDTQFLTINNNSSNNNDINKHLEWYSSKPIPYILQNQLNINKYQTMTTKLIYHPKLKHFVLIVISHHCNQNYNKKQSKHKTWCMDIYERDAKPFLWQYAFDTKYLYHQKRATTLSKSDEYQNKKNALLKSLSNFEFWNILEYATDLIVADLKAIGIDISLGYDNLNELSHILQEIILKESTQNPSFQNDGLKEEDLLKSNIEKYIFKKSEFYKSYYDIHSDKIKIVYTDWYHTEHIEMDGIFMDKDSVFKWSPNYKYLLMNGYINNGSTNRYISELHLFEFEIKDNNNSIQKMKHDELMRKHHLNNHRMSHELLDKLQEYGYYKSSSLHQIYGIKSHQQSIKHVHTYENHNIYAKITALTFTKCTLYFALENDYKIIRAIKWNELFDDMDMQSCNHPPPPPQTMTMTNNIMYDMEENSNDNMSYYEYLDSLMEITQQLTPCTDCISNAISDIMVINESTLLITQRIEYNSYFMSYTTSLLHIPLEYQYIDQCVMNRDNINENRWYVIDKRNLYRNQLNSNQYYYRHENIQKDIQHKEHKYDRLGSWMSSIHSSSSQIIANNLKRERKKENKLHFQPSLFLSKSQNERSSIVTSTPYFISLNHNKYSFDDTVEIVNIKSMTTFTQSALNKNGDLLAILDNTDSILVLKKNQHPDLPLQNDNNNNINNMGILFEEILNDKNQIDIFKSDGWQLSFNEFLVKTGIKSESDLSKILNNETMIDILSQFIRNELLQSSKENSNNKNENNKNDEVEWKVSVEFTATSIMSHLKPINIICISLDDEINEKEANGIDGYVVVLFENGVISSYVIQNNINSESSQNNNNSFFLPNGAIDFWLETCIDWIELMFLMSFGLYFICSCCRRSRVRIGLGRERVINAVDANANVNANANANANANVNNANVNANANANNDRPRRGAVDANNNNINNIPPQQIQPINNGNNIERPPLILNDLNNNNELPQNDNNNNNNDNDEKNEDESKDNTNPNERAIKAAMSRFLNQNVNISNGPIGMLDAIIEEKKEGKEEKDEKNNDDASNEDDIQFVRIFDVPNNANNNWNDNNGNVNHNNNRIDVQSLSGNNNITDDTEQSSPLSPLSPAINPSINESQTQ